jgi:hypothetical protein
MNYTINDKPVSLNSLYTTENINVKKVNLDEINEDLNNFKRIFYIKPDNCEIYSPGNIFKRENIVNDEIQTKEVSYYIGDIEIKNKDIYEEIEEKKGGKKSNKKTKRQKDKKTKRQKDKKTKRQKNKKTKKHN